MSATTDTGHNTVNTVNSVNTVIYPVSDLVGAKAVFTVLLGTEPHTDQPYYVGYNVGGQEIALDPDGHRKGLAGAVPFWTVEAIAERVAALTGAGATVVQQPTDVGGGKLTAVLKDSDGNLIGLIQP